MNHLIETHKDKDFPKEVFGMEFTDRPRDLCSCCPEKAATVVTLWRSSRGNSFNLCGRCAQELGIQLIRRT